MELIFSRGAVLASLLRSVPKQLTNNLPVTATSTRYTAARKFNIFERCNRYKPTECNYVRAPSNVFLPEQSLLPKSSAKTAFYSDSTHSPKDDCHKSSTEQKPSIFQKMKQLTKDYWHILIPVHVITSTGWVAIFYLAIKNGVDIVGLLETVNLSEKYLEMLKNSSAGNWALTYALYKIFTPLRYTVTVGGTTMAIRYLNKFGYLKAPKLTGRSIEKTQSDKSATEHKAKCKAEFKDQRHTEPPKT